MVKNTHGGSKHKKRASKNVYINKNKNDIKNLVKTDGQEYAYINEVYGNGRYRVICWDKKNRLGILRGKLKKRRRCIKNDIVLVGLRDYQDEKCDIILIYDAEQIQVLLNKNIITSSFIKNGMYLKEKTDDLNILFTNNVDNNNNCSVNNNTETLSIVNNDISIDIDDI